MPLLQLADKCHPCRPVKRGVYIEQDYGTLVELCNQFGFELYVADVVVRNAVGFVAMGKVVFQIVLWQHGGIKTDEKNFPSDNRTGICCRAHHASSIPFFLPSG